MRPIPKVLVVLTLAVLAAASPVYAGNAFFDPIYGYTVTRDVVYGYGKRLFQSDKALKCDIYQPVDIGLGPVPQNRPAIVIQDGGAWTSCSKDNGRVVTPAIYQAQRGFTVVVTDFRLIEDFGIPGRGPFGDEPYDGLSLFCNFVLYPGFTIVQCAIEDFAVAIAWTRSNAASLGINPGLICACGGSSGGIDVLLLQYNHNPINPAYAAQAVVALVSTMCLDRNRINPGGPPVFLLNNKEDPLIWYWDIPPMVDRFNECGIYCEPWLQETRLNHDVDLYENIGGETVLERMRDFFCNHFAGGPLPVGYTLALGANPSAAGSIIADPLPDGSGKYAGGTVVTLTANPATGYEFTNWSGDASGSGCSVQVTMSANRSVSANFVQLRYALSLSSNPPGGGTVNAVPPPGGDGKYAYGTVVTLTASPATDYGFSVWSGDASGSSNPVQVTMTADRSVTASFILLRYALALAVNPSGSGSIDATPPPDGDGKYANGTIVTLTASPAAGYLFGSWSGDASGTDNPTQVTMNGNKSVTAGSVRGFTLGLVLPHDTWGTVTVEPNLTMYPEGSAVTLTAVPISGKSFAGWTIDDPNYPQSDPRYLNPVDANTLADPLVLPLTMTGNMQVEADFKCGSGIGSVLPLGLIGLLAVAGLRRRS